MSNMNMINPANYYNPFARYNYVSKTRGAYIPQDTQLLSSQNTETVQKSSNIWSQNYDAETDVMQSINTQPPKPEGNEILGFFSNLFNIRSDKN